MKYIYAFLLSLPIVFIILILIGSVLWFEWNILGPYFFPQIKDYPLTIFQCVYVTIVIKGLTNNSYNTKNKE